MTLYNNNIIFIKLDQTIAATDGSLLEEDITYYFTTTYDPMYSSLRRIQLDLGPLVSNIPNDTVNLAIFEASLSADANNFQDTITNSGFFNFARREYTTCLAELTLVRALLGDSYFAGKMSKTLGDLQVSRSGPDLKKKEDELEQCVARWQVSLQTGGEIAPDTSVQPGYSVKGGTAEDVIGVGREWEPTATAGSEAYQKPLANNSVQVTTRRWYRTFRRR